MLVFIHTITISTDELQLSTRFYHALKANLSNRKIQSCLLGKKVAICLKARKRTGRTPNRSFNTRHYLEAIKIDGNLSGGTSPGGYQPHAVAKKEIPVQHQESLPSPVPQVTSEQLQTSTTSLTSESTCQQTAQWLRKNSFGGYAATFSNFNGADILRLTRDDLIQICGLADGIRLLYALHSKAIVQLTLYLSTPGSAVYHALYLDQVSRGELVRKLASLLGVLADQVQDVYVQGPAGIKVLVTDELVSHLKDEAMFMVDVINDMAHDRLVVLLKPSTSPA